MSRKSRQQSLRQSKERRQKQIVVGGAVLLAILLAFELPHYLGGGGSSSSPAGTTAATSTTATTATSNSTATASATVSSGTAAAALTPTTHTRLPNSDVPPTRTKSQLASFEHFDSKDPFVQQVTAETAPTSPAPAPAPGLGGSSAPAGGSPTTGLPAQQTAARVTLGRETAATIEVNGKTETVQVGSAFPSANPIFKLVSLSNGAAEIGIANGAYASGAHTVSLTVGNPLTLVDTADGVRYELQLLSGS